MSSESLQEKAYRYIRGRIASGHLHAGSVVSEASLAKEIGISRTPVREAIRQLKTEGLVKQVPRYGTVIRTPSRHEIVELFQFREAVESYAASIAAAGISKADLLTLKQLCEQIDIIERELEQSGEDALDADGLRNFLAVDMAFHAVLLRAAGNARIAKTVNDLRVLTRIFSAESRVHDLAIVREANACHKEIFEAVELSDGEAARLAMARHISSSLRISLQHFDRMRMSEAGRQSVNLDLPEDVIQSLQHMEL